MALVKGEWSSIKSSAPVGVVRAFSHRHGREDQMSATECCCRQMMDRQHMLGYNRERLSQMTGRLLFQSLNNSHQIMRIPLTLLLVLVLSGSATVAGQEENRSGSPPTKSDITILYVGRKPVVDSSARSASRPAGRMVQFEELLTTHFKTVTTLDVSKYKASVSDDYDVTVFDAMPPAIERIDMGTWTRSLRFPADFDRPAVVVGNVGPRALGRNGIGKRLDHL